MDDLLAARSQMAMSLAFHIIFAAIGIAMPLLMVIAEWKWLRTRAEVYLELAQRWAKGTAILFAVGAVSGTVLSFELGLLWPRFMASRLLVAIAGRLVITRLAVVDRPLRSQVYASREIRLSRSPFVEVWVN